MLSTKMGEEKLVWGFVTLTGSDSCLSRPERPLPEPVSDKMKWIKVPTATIVKMKAKTWVL
jgi:hypothetical protein